MTGHEEIRRAGAAAADKALEQTGAVDITKDAARRRQERTETNETKPEVTT